MTPARRGIIGTSRNRRFSASRAGTGVAQPLKSEGPEEANAVSSPASWFPTSSDTLPPPGLPESGHVVVYQATLPRESWIVGALEGSGVDVGVCRNFDEMLASLDARQPDLLVLDWSLPDCDLLCQNLKLRTNGAMPLVAIDWRESSEDEAVRALTAGADEYFAEPARTLELRARVQSQLRNKRRLDTLVRLRAERDSLRFDARLDELTHVLNRRALGAALRELVVRSAEFSLLFLDLDHFKRINDELGHSAGDQALAEFARLVKAELRPGDIFGRYGGEEFVVLLRGANEEAASRVAERIRTAVERATVAAVPWGFTVSSGVAVHDPFSGETAEALVARADLALYRAKRSGRNCVAFAPLAREVSTAGTLVSPSVWAQASTSELVSAAGS
jgi:two-component system cell cycle response regulator